MSAALALDPAGTPDETGPAVARLAVVQMAAVAACKRVAPLWPLATFVAVNPFLGWTDRGFGETCAALRRIGGIDALMPRAFYRDAIAAGLITEEDLLAAAASLSPDAPAPADLVGLKEAMGRDPAEAARPKAVVATVAEVLDALAAGDKRASRTAFMIDEISKWCAAYFDEGQAGWALPTQSLPPYRAWRAAMRHDRNPEAMGISGFRAAVASLPADPMDAIGAVVDDLGIPERALEDYLLRALLDIGGWAAYARYKGWDSELDGRADDTLLELLAIRVVWGYALFRERRDPAFQEAWAEAMRAAAALPADERLGDDPDLALDLVLHEAYEAASRRRLLTGFDRVPQPGPVGARRPLVQAAFCIDVRSEVFRRALETTCPEAETIGFAGFFGFPIEYVPIGRQAGGAQCPVLLKPSFVVCEAVAGDSDQEVARIAGLRKLRARVIRAWAAFKLSAVSSFAYVETAGLASAAKLIGASLGKGRPVPDPRTAGLNPAIVGRLGPRLAPDEVEGRRTGLRAEQQLATAEGVLRAMSLTDNFAPLVLLVGHGSTTVNNPHGAGLDCGACGGHTGEANARVAAAVLNDPEVRAGLAARGIAIPADTWFVPGLHDTTTDEVRLFEADRVPAGRHRDLERVRQALAEAADLARAERAALLGLAGAPDLGREIAARSRDWAQVRPEWGLARNAAFVAAPRARTRGLDLGGRGFLHDYDWRKDEGFKVLELIMTAPMVVASWINLQYYGSTVNNRVWGSGDKTLHNVVGELGVLEGNAGDLRTGLPWQSVHDGAGFVHEPVRLNVLIAAPQAAIEGVLAKHDGVRLLVENRWLHLFALSDEGGAIRHYQGGGRALASPGIESAPAWVAVRL